MQQKLSLKIATVAPSAKTEPQNATSTPERCASMNRITAKINKANGRTLGFSLFLNGDVVEALGVHGDALTLDVRVENGAIILISQ